MTCEKPSCTTEDGDCECHAADSRCAVVLVSPRGAIVEEYCSPAGAGLRQKMTEAAVRRCCEDRTWASTQTQLRWLSTWSAEEAERREALDRSEADRAADAARPRVRCGRCLKTRAIPSGVPVDAEGWTCDASGDWFCGESCEASGTRDARQPKNVHEWLVDSGFSETSHEYRDVFLACDTIADVVFLATAPAEDAEDVLAGWPTESVDRLRRAARSRKRPAVDAGASAPRRAKRCRPSSQAPSDAAPSPDDVEWLTTGSPWLGRRLLRTVYDFDEAAARLADRVGKG